MGAKYDSKVDKWLTDDGLLLLQCWARDFTYGDIAEKIGIAYKTLVDWRKKYPEIDEALQKGKEVVDYQVENALLKVALGFSTTETKTIISPPDKYGNRKIRVEKTEKEIPPNPTAIMCWLNNRKPEQWKRNRDNVLSTDDKDNKITVNIIQHGKSDKDEEWTASTSKSSKSKKAKQKRDAKKAADADDMELTDEEREWLEEE